MTEHRNHLSSGRGAVNTVNHPQHYQHPSGIECIDISRHLPHALASALEYAWRHRHKNGVEDLRKAAWWLNDWLAHSTPYTVPGSCYLAIKAMRDDPDYPLLYAILSGDACLALALIDKAIKAAVAPATESTEA